jgi:tRNA G18 (ribose-2'-O)-methylase SpoU
VHEVTEVTDPADPRIADFRDLTNADRRPDRPGGKGLVIAEGVPVVRRLLHSPYRPRAVLGVPARLADLAADLAGMPFPVYATSADVLTRTVGFHLNRGVLAAADRAPEPAPGPLLAAAGRVLVLEGVNDHENLGALFRNAAGLGVDAVLLGPRCADPLYRRSVKVGMGAVFSMPWTRLPDWYDALPDLTARGFTTVALTLAEDASPVEEAVAGLDRVALVLGSEGHGLSPRWEYTADRRAVIAMREGIDSLNVAAATAVACYITARR